MADDLSSPRSADLDSFLIGFCTGLRSATPSASIAWAQHWGWLRSEGIFAKPEAQRALLTLGAAGELVIDKLPFTPSRLETRGLVVRTLGGGFNGATIAASNNRSWGRGVLLGVAGAVVGSYAGYHFRVGAGSKLAQSAEESGSSPAAARLAVALVEDAAAVLGSLLVLKRSSRS